MPPTTVAVVTGASRGLGLALARRLLASGAAVVTLARSHNAGLAAEAQQFGAHLQQIQCDLADASAIESAAGLLADAQLPNGERYLLFNNAATLGPVDLADHLFDALAIQRTFTLNVAAVMVLTAAFLRSTPTQADRRIINISSGAGRKPTPGWSVYCSTKAALDHYSRVLAIENPGLRVAALAPGVVDTSMQEHIRSTDRRQFPDLDRFLRLHEQNQLAAPEAVAGKILDHVASDAFGREVLDDIRNYD